jgi:twitching motility protein PilT
MSSAQLDEILKLATQKGASDIHLKAGIIPVVRKHGALRPLSSSSTPLTGAEIEAMAFSIMDDEQKEHFKKFKDVDLSYGLSGFGRYRVNVLKQRGTVRMVIRYIPDRVLNIEELNLPPTLKKIAEEERGLVLVTGATGSGKTSTLAAMIDHINRTQSKHILMIEDPTEFLVKDRKSIITQRELGADTISFAHSLRAALRQDPDVILVGEMRDRETIEVAMLAAETGHLVLSTLHTIDAQESINRILAAFDATQQQQVRLQLGSVLKGIVSQRLCVRKDTPGFIPALEILINNPRVAECIADPRRTVELRKIMEEGDLYGMRTFDQSLMELVAAEKITYEEALKTSTSPENFAIRYSGVSSTDGKKWGSDSTHFQKRVQDNWQALPTVDMETALHDIGKDFGKSKDKDKDKDEHTGTASRKASGDFMAGIFGNGDKKPKKR